MKNYFYYFLLSFAMASCASADDEAPNAATLSYKKSTATAIDTVPQNTSNPYDYAGALHNDILFAYYADDELLTSLDSITQKLMEVAQDQSLFSSYFGSANVSLTYEDIQKILHNPRGALLHHMSESTLSNGAQDHFQQFVANLQTLVTANQEYIIIHRFITDYEATVFESPHLSQSDKATLLSITSTVRYATYAKKKPRKKNRDLDWDWMITSIAGASAGSNGDCATGILTAVALDIADTDLPR